VEEMLPVTKQLSYNAKKALVKGIIIGSLTIVIYLLVVVTTTPSLPPISAINAAFKINSIIIFGLAVGVGTQVFISSYSKSLGCRIDKKGKEDKKGIFRNVSSGSSTAISSFFSFFSLVPLGCCGSWLLILSLLPSIFGSTLAVILIGYSKILSYIGLIIVLGFVALSALKLGRELIERMRGGSKNLNISKSRLLKENAYYNNNENNI
jgi:hypothetical protein